MGDSRKEGARAVTLPGRGWAALLLSGAVLLAAGACGDDPAAPADAPSGHTVTVDGVPHAPGLATPQASCASCHGADLQGGTDGEPGCFTCHGRTW